MADVTQGTWRTVTCATSEGERAVRYRLIRSSRIRVRIRLEVDVETDDVVVRLGADMPAAWADRLVRDKADWLSKAIRETRRRRRARADQDEESYRPCDGGQVLFRGKLTPICLGAETSHVEQDGNIRRLCLAVSADASRERIEDALRQLLQKQAVAVVESLLSPLLLRAFRLPVSWRISDAKRRWGSCSTDRTIRYAWRLVFLEDELVRYVLAHELAHLIHMNHSPAFWAEVERLYPQWKTARARMRAVTLPPFAR